MRSSKRRIALAGVVSAAALCCLLALPLAASAAPSPWWNIVAGSRPTNLWEPEDNLQEIQVQAGTFKGNPATAAKILVEGKAVGCLGAEDAKENGKEICADYGFALSETAAELQAALEPSLGSDIEVSGGPTTLAPFEVRVPDRYAASVKFAQESIDAEHNYTSAGTFSAKVVNEGGSGRLFVVVANIGDAPMDASKKPLRITDELPEGLVASGAEGVGGGKGSAGLVDCEVEAPDLVSCTFGDVLQPYDSIEVEIPVTTPLGEAPVEGAAGKVAVSGGNAPTETAEQNIEVSPQKTPFGIERFTSRVEAEGGGSEEEGGALDTRAGGHPFQLTTSLQFNSGRMRPSADPNKRSVEQPAQPRNTRFSLPAGLTGNLTALPTCSFADFSQESEVIETANRCSDETAIGAASLSIYLEGAISFARPAVPVFNLPPAVGEPARFGFTIANVAVIIDTEVDPDNEYRVIASVNNASQVPEALGATLSIWGAPGDARHDNARGWGCVYNIGTPRPLPAAPGPRRRRLPAPAGLLLHADGLRRRSRTLERAARHRRLPALFPGVADERLQSGPLRPADNGRPDQQAGRQPERPGLPARDAGQRPLEQGRDL
ncbi:MAG TPA: hypothetical protein VLK37_09995 [Solirubrobacterales bacterium]|nr:hypothetical protein [Solirubrobacterales bacterium]